MKKTLRDRIAALTAMNVPALREEHRKLFGKDPVSSHRQFLFRKIAWRLQADAEGWQPDQARELACGVARNSPLRSRVISNASKRRAGIKGGAIIDHKPARERWLVAVVSRAE